MSFRCSAPIDCSCLNWNHGQIRAACFPTKCKYLVKSYKMKHCNCGAKNSPLLYGEGTARQYINDTANQGPLAWSEFSGYVVECPDCKVKTPFCQSPEEAVRLWNGGRKEKSI